MRHTVEVSFDAPDDVPPEDALRFVNDMMMNDPQADGWRPGHIHVKTAEAIIGIQQGLVFDFVAWLEKKGVEVVALTGWAAVYLAEKRLKP